MHNALSRNAACPLPSPPPWRKRDGAEQDQGRTGEGSVGASAFSPEAHASLANLPSLEGLTPLCKTRPLDMQGQWTCNG